MRNLNSIKKLGILPIERLKEKHIKYYYNDESRLDAQLGGSSVSITSLNIHLLRTFQRRNKRRWAEIEINPNVVARRNCFFYSCNAASSIFKGAPEEYLSSYDALTSMFAETVTSSTRTFKRKNKKPNQTTDDQAEIIVKWMIPKSQLLGWREINV